MQRLLDWLYEMKKKDEAKKMEEEHQKNQSYDQKHRWKCMTLA